MAAQAGVAAAAASAVAAEPVVEPVVAAATAPAEVAAAAPAVIAVEEAAVAAAVPERADSIKSAGSGRAESAELLRIESAAELAAGGVESAAAEVAAAET